VTIPANISRPFMTGDAIQYSCNGALIPDTPTTLTCTLTDQEEALGVWLPTLLPDCSE